MLLLTLMKELIFSTGNADKFASAQSACTEYGLTFTQSKLDIDEIQGENSERIARDKANKAFVLVQKPLVVTDDSWAFLGLNGFPGAYMRSMNHWFTPEDFLRLTLPLQDRQVLLKMYVVYQDAQRQKLFTGEVSGKLLKEVRGHSDNPSHSIVSLDGDNGLSIAEVYEQGTNLSQRQSAIIWHQFAKWYTAI
ncbi:MAG: RdgB/HAM1 family non-canonical purine pyrophosphatase, dITP/XTP pyrophosphatase [Candidatus Saccharibacteria bacterium]|nr:RdgB/HAM1 family non-canonical purine pyrophosphatase, dITP/XTP pyrophosphatase [Candidatus Saccharibacteria bacterium]